MKFAITALTCLLAFSAQAKITLEKKVLTNDQVNTIKGFIYEAYVTQTKKQRKKALQPIARAIDWINEVHKSDKIYEVNKLITSEKTTPLILAVAYIVQMVSEPCHDPHIKDYYLQLWTDRGSRVRILYKNKNGKKVYSAILIDREKTKEKKKNENNKR